MSESMETLRARITDNDRLIVAAVNARLRIVAELWELKRALGADQFDPDRERRLRAELAAANTGPLTAKGLDRLVDELLALTKEELETGPQP